MTLTASRRPDGATSQRLLSSRDLLFASRFSCGVTPALVQDIKDAGSGRNWFVAQLDPGSVADAEGDEVDSWFDYLQQDTQQIYNNAKNKVRTIDAVMLDLSRRTVARRLQSKRQVQEAMVDFWSNLLHVPINDLAHRAAAFPRPDYDRVIRTYALDTFENLLQHTIVHPSMGINLNNNTSTKQAPNENLGRELLELHTVGVDGGYTEDDVKNSAKILTGYRVFVQKRFDAQYVPASHYTGPVKVLDFESDNADADGQAVTMEYLSYLAHHPKTAERMARRLCVKFVRDDPSDALVQAVAAAYTANDTAIVPTLLAMVDHPSFRRATGLKLRTPQEDWQAMVRSLGVVLQQPTSSNSYAKAMYVDYASLDDAPYEWGPPNGYPEVNAAWSGGGRMLAAFQCHQRMALTPQRWPQADVPALSDLVPAFPMTLRSLTDAYALRFFGVPATQATRNAVVALLGRKMTDVITKDDAAKTWLLPGIVATLLDSPQHLFR